MTDLHDYPEPEVALKRATDRDRCDSSLSLMLRIRTGTTDIIWMGNSTGCQNIATYLSSTAVSPQDSIVKGGILQAPVSDREAYEHAEPNGPLAEDAETFLGALDGAREMIKAGRGGEIAGQDVCRAAGARITWDRLFSLYAKG